MALKDEEADAVNPINSDVIAKKVEYVDGSTTYPVISEYTEKDGEGNVIESTYAKASDLDSYAKTTDLSSYAKTTDVVKLTGAQIVRGVKTFFNGIKVVGKSTSDGGVQISPPHSIVPLASDKPVISSGDTKRTIGLS